MTVYASTPWRVEGGTIRDKNGNLLATVQYTAGNEQDQSNAAIMAAAPELMQACIMALTGLQDMSTDEFAAGGDRKIRQTCEKVLTRIMRMANNEDFSIYEQR